MPNLPDLGKTPQERSQGTADSTTAAIKSHNSNLNSAPQEIAKNRNVNIIPLDINALFNEVIDQPDRFSKNFASAINYEIMIGREDFSNNAIKGEIRYQF